MECQGYSWIAHTTNKEECHNSQEILLHRFPGTGSSHSSSNLLCAMHCDPIRPLVTQERFPSSSDLPVSKLARVTPLSHSHHTCHVTQNHNVTQFNPSLNSSKMSHKLWQFESYQYLCDWSLVHSVLTDEARDRPRTLHTGLASVRLAQDCPGLTLARAPHMARSRLGGNQQPAPAHTRH